MGRHSKAVKLVGGVRGGLALLDDDERRRAIEAGERDIDDGVGFFRGTARPDTALMAACIDEFKDRFRVGPVRGALAASPDCGFITPRGCRMSGSGPVSRMAARREASSGSMPISSWPCTGAAGRAPDRRHGAGIRPRSAAAR